MQTSADTLHYMGLISNNFSGRLSSVSEYREINCKIFLKYSHQYITLPKRSQALLSHFSSKWVKSQNLFHAQSYTIYHNNTSVLYLASFYQGVQSHLKHYLINPAYNPVRVGDDKY